MSSQVLWQTVFDTLCGPDHPARCFLYTHSVMVKDFCLEIMQRPHIAKRHHNADIQFITEAAMLHDIGIIYTDAHRIGCSGSAPYIRHGVLGRKILEEYGLRRHALVCERHVGSGLSKKIIIERDMPLPHRDMSPRSFSEKLICYADCFFSKTKNAAGKKKSLEKVISGFSKYGQESVSAFLALHQYFGSF